jgi:hypothetical protein
MEVANDAYMDTVETIAAVRLRLALHNPSLLGDNPDVLCT